jgi:hypothetical protein
VYGTRTHQHRRDAATIAAIREEQKDYTEAGRCTKKHFDEKEVVRSDTSNRGLDALQLLYALAGDYRTAEQVANKFLLSVVRLWAMNTRWSLVRFR